METKSVEMAINRLTGQRYSEISGQISAEGLDQLWLADGDGGGVYFGKTPIGAGASHGHAGDSWFTAAIQAVKTWAEGLFSKLGHTHKKSEITDFPDSLKNPNALTFTGSASGSYDGSAAKTVSIPAAPQGATTWTVDGTSVTVNASAAKTIKSNVQSDWNATSGDSAILNKPTLAKVATSGSYSDLSGRPSSMKNPYSLTAGTKSYDGSTSVSIGAADVAAIPAGAVTAIVSAASLPPNPDPHTLYIVPD